MGTVDLSSLRKFFPALNKEFNGRRIYFDGAGGTQVTQSVIDAMMDYLINNNGNYDGHFDTSITTGKLIIDIRKSMADFLNAPSWKEILLGPNMTTLTFSLVWAISKNINPGDEILLDRSAHGANIDSWHYLQECGAVIKFIEFNKGDCRLDYDMAEKLIGNKTKLVAVGLASNVTGTIHDVRRLASMAHKHGALIFADAVHAAPHIPIDVVELEVDFLACSAYKFFGPHVGFIWGKSEHLEKIDPHRPWSKICTDTPSKYVLGTPNIEGFAGTMAVLDYFEMIGKQYGAKFEKDYPNLTGRRLEMKKALAAIREYEIMLALKLNDGLKKKKGLKVYGITDPEDFKWRCPTFSFTLDGYTSVEISKKMNKKGIFVWDGKEGIGAYELAKYLDLIKIGGLLRVSLVHYNTLEEIESFLEVLHML